MNITRFLLICLCVTLSLNGCRTASNASAEEEMRPPYAQGTLVESGIPIGPWKNISQGDGNLAGIVVNQLPEVPEDAASFSKGAHPSCIHYVYWDGLVKSLTYSPTGKLLIENESHLSLNDGFWRAVDFSYGSDPNFRTHKDPRKELPSSRN